MENLIWGKSLAIATRDHARLVDEGKLDRLDDASLACLSNAMGPRIWAWQVALRLTGGRPWRAGLNQPEASERRKADRLMRADIGLWERAILAHGELTDEAEQAGAPWPEPLAIPPDIMATIEAKRAATVQRAARRRQKAEEGDGPAPDGPGAPKP